MFRFRTSLAARWTALPLAALLLALALPGRALAHGGGEGQASVLAGPLAWAFLVFGLTVIAGVAIVLFTGRREPGPVTPERFHAGKGIPGYVAKMRLFSRNARLYMVHVVGMDVIHGTWMVLFNLYLLELGFPIAFIGLRILLASITRALFAVPAGLISDRLGRKLSFILGDGGGAVMSLIAISTGNPALLLATGALGGVFSAVHGVAEPAFMAENSADYERVHLFSVAEGTRTAAAIIGSVLAGLAPLLLAGAGPDATIQTYRLVAYAGIAGWFASLIPALMLEQTALPSAPMTGLRDLFANVTHPDRIWRLTAPEVVLAFGAGFVLPLLNVFFHQGLGSPEVEIGVTFAAGQAFLVVAAFLAPLLALRLGKVRSVVFTRLAAVPFLALLAFSPDVGSALGSVLTVAGLAHIARITFMNMAGPIRAAFAMELLDPGERGTQVGIQMALAGAVSGLGSFLGSRLMDAGNYQAPFMVMAAFLTVSALLFWRFFAGQEKELALETAQASAAAD